MKEIYYDDLENMICSIFLHFDDYDDKISGEFEKNGEGISVARGYKKSGCVFLL